MKLVGQSQHLYSHIIDAVDGSAITIATDLEMKEPGSGCAYILNLAREKGVLIPMGSSGTELDFRRSPRGGQMSSDFWMSTGCGARADFRRIPKLFFSLGGGV